MKSAKKTTQKPGKSTAGNEKKSSGFTAEERAAMKDRVEEIKAEGSRKAGADDEAAVLAKIAALPDSDRAMAERIHALIRQTAPALTPRTWYGMPAYANNGNVVCFFQDAHKFKTRYATLGFSDKAKLDEDDMWPTTFALKELTPVVEAKIAALIKRAIG